MGKKLLLLFLLITISTYSQDREKIPFSRAVQANINEYVKKSETAFDFKNFKRVEFLFDSIINHVVKGSYLDNFEVNRKNGKKINLHQFKKPIVLLTSSSWCVPGKGEIPALNAIAEKYHKAIDFVVLFWESKQKTRKASRDYSRNVHIVYVDEVDNTSDNIIRSMKHSFGIPTTFLIDENKMIVDIRRGVIYGYHEEFEVSYKGNYNSFLSGVSSLQDSLDENEGMAIDKSKHSKEL